MKSTTETSNKGTYIILALLLIILTIWYIEHNENKTLFEKASDDISDGVSNAADEFKDKTPVEKIGDAVKDAGQKIKDSTD